MKNAVRCETHTGPGKPGYVVCDHVLAGEPVGLLIDAAPDRLGQILCGRVRHEPDQARLVCADCAREKGWVK